MVEPRCSYVLHEATADSIRLLHYTADAHEALKGHANQGSAYVCSRCYQLCNAGVLAA